MIDKKSPRQIAPYSGDIFAVIPEYINIADTN